MQTTTQGLELSVAILMDDLASAKEIASALRQHQILAHHYQTLEEFWVTSTLQTPDLAIVDVTKMSQGSVQFRNHPKVKDNSMAYAFFSKDSTKILLQSTLGLNPMGYLHQDISLSSQVMSLVSKRMQEIKTKKERAELEERVKRLQARSQRLLSDRSEAEEFRAHFDFIQNLCAEIEDDSTRQDFTHALMNKLEKWEGISGYGIFELNQSGQKLISPEVSKKKFHPFPSLWLGQVNQNGIDGFAVDMATQVANDLFETQPVLIKINAGSMKPELLLYLSFSTERLMNFPWEVLETMLSSSFRKLKLYKEIPQYSSQFLPMWEAMDTMDRLQNIGVESDTRIVALSLIPLTDAAKKRAGNKFFWSAFFNDFFLQLSGRLQRSTKLSLFGPWHVLFFIPKESLEAETQMLQSFTKQFSYWKFFEDNAQVLSADMLPTLKLIPASSAHYLRIFEKEFAELAVAEEGKLLLNQGRGFEKRLSL
jgi:DNA-binding NarL/FixJ family response regulator